MSENNYQHLETRQGSLYRQPFIKGTRIRAEIPYGNTVSGHNPEEVPAQSPEEVAADFRIPVAAVLEAIDWCQKHWDVVCADHAREARLMEAKEPRLRIVGASGEWLIWAQLDALKEAWQKPLRW